MPSFWFGALGFFLLSWAWVFSCSFVLWHLSSLFEWTGSSVWGCMTAIHCSVSWRVTIYKIGILYSFSCPKLTVSLPFLFYSNRLLNMTFSSTSLKSILACKFIFSISFSSLCLNGVYLNQDITISHLYFSLLYNYNPFLGRFWLLNVLIFISCTLV